MIKYYRKRPVAIRAIQYDGSNIQEIMLFTQHRVTICQNNVYTVQTLEGDMKISIGDFVIEGVNGEFYPCKPDIFEKTYEEVL